MNILIVGNVLKDVYLNLDTRTETFEKDKNGTNWLSLSFDASEHHFFSRVSNFGGAAVSLEVCEKMGLGVKISGANISFKDDAPCDAPAETYRYILMSDDEVSYFVPSKLKVSPFIAPEEPVDCLYIDRSANLTESILNQISDYLAKNEQTKLVIYLRKYQEPKFSKLLPRADLVFYEENPTAIDPKTSPLDFEKTVFITETALSFQNIIEPINIDRVDRLTHLSAYSIAAATFLCGFALDKTPEKCLKMARINLENSSLDSSLSLPELGDIVSDKNSLELIAANLVLPGKGILAADESGGSIAKKFAGLGIEDNFQNRHDYRNLFFTTKDIEKYLNGIILFDETARDKAENGQSIPDFLISKRIIPGIKVDQGLETFENSTETYAKGLNGLENRLAEYYEMGLRFAKWRAAFNLKTNGRGEILTPTTFAIKENCEILAKYAKKCQSAGLVPIVEPELVYDGYYSIEHSATTTAKILDCLFASLAKHNVNLRATVLKVNMVMAGKQKGTLSTPKEIGEKTAEVLKNHVPKELAGVVFLSGGQTPEQAVENLSEIVKHGPFPFPVTFSFARALQDPALYAWQGDNKNADNAREAFLNYLVRNAKALEQK